MKTKSAEPNIDVLYVIRGVKLLGMKLSWHVPEFEFNSPTNPGLACLSLKGQEARVCRQLVVVTVVSSSSHVCLSMTTCAIIAFRVLISAPAVKKKKKKAMANLRPILLIRGPLCLSAHNEASALQRERRQQTHRSSPRGTRWSRLKNRFFKGDFNSDQAQAPVHSQAWLLLMSR